MAKSEMGLRVEGLIYPIRGERVLLDQDIAQLYELETKALIQAVKRNKDRFPSDFMFQLSDQEVDALRCQIGTSKPGRGGRRYNPWAFTEHGILMLSSVLRSNRAAQVNVQIMRSFVRLREMAASHEYLIQRLDDLEERYDKNFREVFTTLKEMIETPPNKKNPIGFRGKYLEGITLAERERNLRQQIELPLIRLVMHPYFFSMLSRT